MKYKLDKKQPTYHMRCRWLILSLILAVGLVTWLAWRNAQPLNCDKVTIRDGQQICEVMVK